MNKSAWKKVAVAGYILMLLVDVIGGVVLMSYAAAAFGVTLEDVTSLSWTQIFRLPIIVCLLAIWLPVLIGMAWAYRLIDTQRYGGSLVVSLLTPLVSLLMLAIGTVLVLLPLGDEPNVSLKISVEEI